MAIHQADMGVHQHDDESELTYQGASARMHKVVKRKHDSQMGIGSELTYQGANARMQRLHNAVKG
jgi:hypothetical protein